MGRIIIGTIILILTIILAVVFYIWAAGDDFGGLFYTVLVYTGITFFLAAGIVISALFIERGIRAQRYGN